MIEGTTMSALSRSCALVSRVASVLALAALLLAIGDPASASPRHDDNEVDGFAISFPSSQIEITTVYAFGVEQEGHHVALPATCVFYVNDGPKPVVHIQFDFSYVSPDGKVGIPEPYDTTGKFAVGVLQNSGHYNCRLTHFAQVLDGQLREIRVFGRPAVYRLVAWVNKVVYADGTTWEAQPPTYVPPPH
jgi:hypothetical protein